MYHNIATRLLNSFRPLAERLTPEGETDARPRPCILVLCADVSGENELRLYQTTKRDEEAQDKRRKAELKEAEGGAASSSSNRGFSSSSYGYNKPFFTFRQASEDRSLRYDRILPGILRALVGLKDRPPGMLILVRGFVQHERVPATANKNSSHGLLLALDPTPGLPPRVVKELDGKVGGLSSQEGEIAAVGLAYALAKGDVAFALYTKYGPFPLNKGVSGGWANLNDGEESEADEPSRGPDSRASMTPESDDHATTEQEHAETLDMLDATEGQSQQPEWGPPHANPDLDDNAEQDPDWQEEGADPEQQDEVEEENEEGDDEEDPEALLLMPGDPRVVVCSTDGDIFDVGLVAQELHGAANVDLVQLGVGVTVKTLINMQRFLAHITAKYGSVWNYLAVLLTSGGDYCEHMPFTSPRTMMEIYRDDIRRRGPEDIAAMAIFLGAPGDDEALRAGEVWKGHTRDLVRFDGVHAPFPARINPWLFMELLLTNKLKVKKKHAELLTSCQCEPDYVGLCKAQEQAGRSKVATCTLHAMCIYAATVATYLNYLWQQLTLWNTRQEPVAHPHTDLHPHQVTGFFRDARGKVRMGLRKPKPLSEHNRAEYVWLFGEPTEE